MRWTPLLEQVMLTGFFWGVLVFRGESLQLEHFLMFYSLQLLLDIKHQGGAK